MTILLISITDVQPDDVEPLEKIQERQTMAHCRRIPNKCIIATSIVTVLWIIGGARGIRKLQDKDGKMQLKDLTYFDLVNSQTTIIPTLILGIIIKNLLIPLLENYVSKKMPVAVEKPLATELKISKESARLKRSLQTNGNKGNENTECKASN